MPDPRETAQTRARLIHTFSKDGDLLSLGVAVGRVVQLASSDDEATRNLTYYVLADVALTQKILRIANTVFYRSVANTPITTVSRAIFVLGFDTVRTTALALLLVDNLANAKHAEDVRREIVEALCASMFGRELARQGHTSSTEEATIASLFGNLGRLLIASHEHEYYQRINDRVMQGVNLTQSALQVIGCSYDFLTSTVLRAWNFPEIIVHGVERLAPGDLHAPRNREEWLRQVVSFSADAAKLVLQTKDAVSTAAGRALLRRYGAALQIDEERLGELFALVGKEIDQVVQGLNLVLANKDVDSKPDRAPMPSALKLAMLDIHTINTNERYDSGKPINARDLLLAGVQVATQMMASGKSKPSELVTLVAETLYNSLGFRFVSLCVIDSRSNQFRTILAMGEKHAERQARFSFPAAYANDIFHLALENQAELMIEDAHQSSIRNLMPEWHRNLLPDARSIMLLPLVQGKRELGVFYGDRTTPAPEGITSDEAALIKILVGQMITAIHLR
ncbi:HDOD domain-containing protein [Massilia sp. TS11]|uniref:HDOD domain-containing protein n=1 Tax=Massilia sp. TS11 TaxID=2908003 RepID=UPI001EDB2ADA|nr:HDOD domain-containing protein [Massilia sp. TS11]MCG2582744.1 HDOD domain-containing protein [Massilia sp. TS11]